MDFLEIHAVFLDQDARLLPTLSNMLDDTEKRRASNFRFDHDRRRWIVARAALRILIARHIHSLPQEIVLGTEHNGKPCLADPKHPLFFNLSHSDDHALIALANTGPVGVDLERFDRGSELEKCMHEFCHAEEIAHVATLDPADEKHRFLIATWCAKEAYLKALGDGLSRSPADLNIEWREGCARVRGDARFVIYFPTYEGIANFCAAVALSGRDFCPEIQMLRIENPIPRISPVG